MNSSTDNNINRKKCEVAYATSFADYHKTATSRYTCIQYWRADLVLPVRTACRRRFIRRCGRIIWRGVADDLRRWQSSGPCHRHVIGRRCRVVCGRLRLGASSGRRTGVGGGKEVAHGDGVLLDGALDSARTLQRVGRRELAGRTADRLNAEHRGSRQVRTVCDDRSTCQWQRRHHRPKQTVFTLQRQTTAIM